MADRAAPWGKIALGALAIFLIGRCSRTDVHDSVKNVNADDSQQPAYSVRIVSQSCEPNYGRPRSDIVIVNEGPEVANLTVFATFGTETKRTHFRPATIPTGGMAEAKAYASHGAPQDCGIAQIQAGDGRPVQFQR
jgi:hypothetical protein